MKRIITLAVLVMGMISTAFADNHVVSISWDYQCLSGGIPITMTLHLKGFNNKDSIQWQSLQPDSTWGNIANETGITFTTYTVGIYRAAVKENCGQKDSIYYSPDVWVSKCSVMPMTLTSFNGIIKSNAVQLHWVTSFEENTSHIEVQQSSDGAYFATIHTVAAAGNSNVALQYAIALPVPTIKGQTVFYRLKMVDMDGAVKFSNTIALSLSSNSVFSKLTVYPNPAHNTLSINLNTYGGNLDKTKIRILDAAGREVFEENLTDTSIDISTLQKGLYFCTVTDGATSSQVKFIKE